MKHVASIGLALALALAGVASACGPSTPDANTPPTPSGEPTSSAAPETSAAPTTSAAPETTSAAPTSAPTQTSAPAGTQAPAAGAPPGPPFMASKMGDELKKAGFDLAKLPPKIDKMSDAQKKKIMPLFVKALGYEGCNGCHADGDFKKKTRNLKIAEHMYDEFVVALRDEKNAATVFCDSCHQGKAKMLNRSDKKAVGKFMDEQYVGHMARADKKSHECGTCHGDTMEMAIFDKLWQANKI